MVKHFCDKCGKEIIDKHSIYHLHIVAETEHYAGNGYSSVFTDRLALCNKCYSDFRKKYNEFLEV